jgi:acyl-CoA dehydrogenase family protein 9
MIYENFLTNLYLGYPESSDLKSFKVFHPDDKALEIINAFRSVSREFSATYLEEQGMVPSDLMEKLRQINFFGLNIPAAYGGVGLRLLQYLKVVEEVVKLDMSLGITALAHLSIGTKGIVLFGNEAQKKKYLVPAAAGEMIFSYALTEPKTGSDAQNIETTATLSDDGKDYILTGQKTYITNANYAGGLTVFAQMDPKNPGFMGAFIVETAWEGVKIGKEIPKMGLKASSTATIQFEDVRVPKENLLGEPGDGFKIAMTILNYGRLALAAASNGMMQQSLDDMAKRSSARTQFGVPINHFELIQEKLVKARVNSWIVSAITEYTAGLLEDDPLALVAIESSHSKLFGTTRAWDTLYDAMQVAGGSGYFNTQPYGKRMRDFRVTTIFEGTTEIHSIYPALYLARNVSKRMLAYSRNKPLQLLFLLKGMFKWPRLKMGTKSSGTHSAVRLARANARRINFMIHLGLLRYGAMIFEKEFFLRKITTLSLYFYGLLAALVKIENSENSGANVDEDLKLLAYFVEEARESRTRNRVLFSSRKEQLHKEIVAEMLGA